MARDAVLEHDTAVGAGTHIDEAALVIHLISTYLACLCFWIASEASKLPACV